MAPPTDSWCKIGKDDPRIVCGARNLPCPNAPGRRGATAKECGLTFDRVTVPGAPAQPRSITFYDPASGRLTLEVVARVGGKFRCISVLEIPSTLF